MKTAATLTLAACLLLPFQLARAAAPSAPSASPLQQTKSFVDAYVTDYNAHHLGAVMRLMGAHITYWDCNYATHQVKKLVGRTAVSRWFKHMFALHDTLEATSTAIGGWIDDQQVPNVFGLLGTRMNDELARQQLPPQSIATKAVLNTGETRMRGNLLAGQANCDAPART